VLLSCDEQLVTRRRLGRGSPIVSRLRAVWVDPAQAGALFRLSPLISSALRARELDGVGVELWDPV
jgi:hypothetical protein